MEGNGAESLGSCPSLPPLKVAISALMRAEGSRVCLRRAEEQQIIGSCQRCVVPAAPLDQERNQSDVERNKRANEQTTKGLWELQAGGLGQGSEKRKRKHVNKAPPLEETGSHFIKTSKITQCFQLEVQLWSSDGFHCTVEVLLKQLVLSCLSPLKKKRENNLNKKKNP